MGRVFILLLAAAPLFAAAAGGIQVTGQIPCAGYLAPAGADLRPSMLACQHGSAYRGDGAALLRELATAIESGNGKLSAQPSAVTA